MKSLMTGWMDDYLTRLMEDKEKERLEEEKKKLEDRNKNLENFIEEETKGILQRFKDMFFSE